MILLYFCVVLCEVFYDFSSNNTFKPERTIPSNNTGVGSISPFIWFEELCDYCFYEWKISYVENASLYTTFLLFTRRSSPNYAVIKINDTDSFQLGGFNCSEDTKIVIHGWLDNGTNFFAEEIRKAYLREGNFNVITVNWPNLSKSIYFLARSAVEPVGRFTATLVDFLVTTVHAPEGSIHLIGHSLGAHIAGVVGEHVTFGKLSRVTGLDPASPMFSSEPDGRLDPTDAHFVDVIHTSGGYLGVYEPCGHVDFYPNGGTPFQPGCWLDFGCICSHSRAYSYFAESISSAGFISTSCDSWSDYEANVCSGNNKTVMGDKVSLSANGTYFLKTNNDSPFALWNDSVTAEYIRKRIETRLFNHIMIANYGYKLFNRRVYVLQSFLFYLIFVS